MIDDDDWPEKPTWDIANSSSTPALAPSFPSNKAKAAVAEEEAEREKECSICFDADLSVIFSPCGHGACTDCVTRIRREVIFKADKGMKCPFCRQHIEHHKTAGTTGGSKAKQALQAQNQHAKQQALASHAVQQQRRITSSSDGSTGNGNLQQWQCMKCKDQNSMTSKMCARCRNVAPSFVLQQLAHSRGTVGSSESRELYQLPYNLESRELYQPPYKRIQPYYTDIMKATPDTLRAWARIKLHPNFNTAFAEAGMPFDLVQCTPGGSEQTILAAIKGGQCKKWKRIVEAMLGNQDCRELATDFYGNYTLQDVIEMAAKMRNAAKNLLRTNAITKAEHDDVLGMDKKGPDAKDFLRRIVLQLQVIANKSLVHPQANYVVAKVLDHGDAMDVMIITEPIFTEPYRLLTPDVKNSKFAIIKTVKAVDTLTKFAFEPGPHKEDCAKHLNKFCQELLRESHKLNALLRHDLGGAMILDAAQGGLPHEAAIQVLTNIANDVNTLRLSSSGVSVLRKFMTLESRNAECREIFITDVCIMASQLSPNYAETANPKYGGPELVQRMLELLSQEQDSICDDWVRHMVSLLVQQSATLVATPGCRELLTYSLDLPAVAKEVPTHLETIRQNCSTAVWKSIKASLTPIEEQGQDGVASASASRILSAQASEELSPQNASETGFAHQPEQVEDTVGFTVVQGSRSKKKGKKGQQFDGPAEPEKSPLKVSKSDTAKKIGTGPPKLPFDSQAVPKNALPHQAPARKRASSSSGAAKPIQTVSEAGPVPGSSHQGPNGTGVVKSQAEQQQARNGPGMDNFLADLLPGLNLGGSATDKAVAAPKRKSQDKPLQGPPPGAFAHTNSQPPASAAAPQAPPYVHFTSNQNIQAPPAAHMAPGFVAPAFGAYQPSFGAVRPSTGYMPTIPLPAAPPGIFFGPQTSQGGQPPFFGAPIRPASTIPPPAHNIAVTPLAPDGHKHVRPAHKRSSQDGVAVAYPGGAAPVPVRHSDEASRGSPGTPPLSFGSSPAVLAPAPIQQQTFSLQQGSKEIKQSPNAPHATQNGFPQSHNGVIQDAGNQHSSAFGGVASTARETPSVPASYGDTLQGKQQKPAEPEWICTTCGYKHEGNEARFLTCALCYQERQS